MKRIFVYGTLMAGECRHGALQAAVSGPALRARTRGVLMNLGDYPALTATGDGIDGWVQGECYPLRPGTDVFTALDKVEGDEYVRMEIDVELEDGATVRAWTYRWSGIGAAGTPIMSGDWRRR